MVFRVKVVDAASYAELNDTQVAGVTVTLPDGSVQNLHYGEHPPGPAQPKYLYWTYAYRIPMDYPTGTFNYSILVTDLNGNTFAPVTFPVGAPAAQIVAAGQL
jgi:hypothetical protein